MSGAVNELELPEIITLNEYGGDFTSYLEAVYAIFKRDFIDSSPRYEGKRLALKKHPYIEGKEYTFYHFTHDGDIETDRLPNLRRLERMPFPRPLIDNSTHPYLKVWRNKRGNKERILIYHEAEAYLVVLEDRGDYILPWTAYLVEYSNRQKKLIDEYEAYIKAKTAQGN
ncbi:hypothetical protein [Algoriphagus pacificus]|jgi:hypothetical protein|uniref:Uncharacterized protein n=1 Tax=Algoriphagus pacificus TaxID=2811234 RepID=A0ABS3CJB3_9BACT|nr:hypothetical protein [Algoriphagus pacificus]MBN7816855.1 hypothetical protein [Algoriphagus pacificus]